MPLSTGIRSSSATAPTQKILRSARLLRSAREGPASTVITAADPAAAVIHVTADGVTLTGLSINGTPEGDTGLAIYGIYLDYADNCTIQENTVSKAGRGVYVYRSDNNTISQNFLTRNDYAVYLNGYGSSSVSPHLAHNNTVTENTATGNNAGLNLAVFRIYAVDDTIVTNNTVTNNGGHGMILYMADEADVAYNTVSSNGDAGIYLWYSNYHTTIHENTVSANAAGFKITKGGGTSNIYLNDITGNDVPLVNDNGHAQDWESPEQIAYAYMGSAHASWMGNYWGSNYTGTDVDGNGIGDEPYIDACTDNYPLMSSFERYTLCGFVVPTEANFTATPLSGVVPLAVQFTEPPPVSLPPGRGTSRTTVLLTAPSRTRLLPTLQPAPTR